ncbi:MAG TPA: lysine--tRNA ligase [Rickettsiales bacterium]|nr:lysine--tRNA ligase [Rickettsiales bacterium]
MNELYKNTKAWPFFEARRIYEKIGGKTPKKGYVLFETGYGPSGLPHIGTFGEVVRTSFVRHAFTLLAPEIPTKMFCVSDDIDGLRKVPDNIPQQEMVRANLGKPLTSVPDPFGTHESYGHHMNSRLKAFLDDFGFEYEFISATDKYKSGAFDETMLRVLEKYEEIMDLMLPTLGVERQATYSPFMPIDPDSRKVIDKGVKGVNKATKTVIYEDENGETKEIPITGGNCKLQWKVDFGARWYSLDVDYEIYGKDHQPNEKIYRKICEILGGMPPVNFTYEMFLSDTGEKISKSKGNGIAVEDWLKYAPSESMSLFMFQKPKTAKRLYFDVIPKAMDDYLAFLENYNKETDEARRLENPVFYIHFGKVPEINFDLNYSLLLNLACACSPDNDEVLWGFISKHKADLSPKTSPLLNKMIHCALNYFNDFVKANRQFHKFSTEELQIIKKLKEAILNFKVADDGNPLAAQLQTLIFTIGKENGYAANIRDWFSLLYKGLFGQTQGPRMGSFIELYGIENFVKMIDERMQ